MNRFIQTAVRLSPYLLAAELLLTLVFALLPVDAMPLRIFFWDKAEHTAVFFLLALTASIAHPKKRALACAWLVAFGALIEVLQAGLTVTRTGELLDLLANGFGIALGSAFYLLTPRSAHAAAEPRDGRLERPGDSGSG